MMIFTAIRRVLWPDDDLREQREALNRITAKVDRERLEWKAFGRRVAEERDREKDAHEAIVKALRLRLAEAEKSQRKAEQQLRHFEAERDRINQRRG